LHDGVGVAGVEGDLKVWFRKTFNKLLKGDVSEVWFHPIRAEEKEIWWEWES
jgi:hypothetical protein